MLSDGSSDSANIEQGCVYLLYLSEGTPTFKFLSIKSVQDADAEGIHNALKRGVSKRFGITNFSDHLVGLNVDGAAVNTGIHNGLGVRLQELSPVMLLNHRLELSIKDAFSQTVAFERVDTFINQVYLL